MANMPLKLSLSKMKIVISLNVLTQICPFPKLPYLNKYHTILLLARDKILVIP